MRIVVILGRVLDPDGIAVNRRAGRIFVNREEYVLQPADRCALEAALRIKDAAAAEVVALPRSLLPDDDILRQALAAGADRAIYLTREGGDQADVATMANILVGALERLGDVDLLLLGVRTLDTGQGQLGPRMAEALDWPHIAQAWSVEVEGGRVQAVQRSDAAFTTVEADIPAVVTVVRGALKPRYPDGVRLINIYKGVGDIAAALEEWPVADVAEVGAPLVERRGQDFPPERERGVRAGGSAGEMAQAVADVLLQQMRG